MKSTTARLLASLDAISVETAHMLDALDGATNADHAARREVKRRVLQIRGAAHEISDYLSAARLEDPRN